MVVDANLAGRGRRRRGVAAAASAILLHSLYETYVDTWFGELWPFLAPAINETRAAFGLAARASWTEVFQPHDRLYAAVPAGVRRTGDGPRRPRLLRHTGFLVPDRRRRPIDRA